MIQRDLEQWFFRTTAYADELLDSTSTPSTGPSGSRPCSATGSGDPKESNSNSRSSGSDADGLMLRVFTTRPDTSFGMTYAVVAPEHPLVDADHHRGAARQRSRGSRLGRGQERARSHLGGRASRRWPSEVPSPVGTSSIRSRTKRSRSMWPTTSSCATARAPSWPSPPRTSVTGNSPRPTASLSCAPHSRPDGFDGGAWTGGGVKENSGFLDGLDVAAAKERAIDMARGEGIGRRDRQLPPTRLVGVAPAVLGMPDPHRLLPCGRGRRGSRGPAARSRSGRCRVPARPASRP